MAGLGFEMGKRESVERVEGAVIPLPPGIEPVGSKTRSIRTFVRSLRVVRSIRALSPGLSGPTELAPRKSFSCVCRCKVSLI